MKLKELRKILDSIALGDMDSHDDDEVVIELKEPSIGYMACAKINMVFCGFDWDSGRIILVPNIPLCRKQNKND